jgi:DnaJ domain
MELAEAYRVLELTPGANEEAVRDARKLLAKVWHPDRHANDPELEKRAQQKLADINTAFEAIRDAKFPPAGAAKAKADAKPDPVGVAKVAAKPEPSPPKAESNLEMVPRRRVRWSVIFLLLAAVGAGAYFAILKLGAKAQTVMATVPADAAVVVADADAAIAVPTTIDDAAPMTAVDAAQLTTATFGLGASQADVQAVMGVPDTLDHTFEQWRYGFSIIYFKEGKVTGWWKRDRPLRVHIDPKNPEVAAKAVAAGIFTIGADPDEVIALQGTPDRIEPEFATWYYRDSSIEFDGRGKVTGWHSVNNTLKIKTSD